MNFFKILFLFFILFATSASATDTLYRIRMTSSASTAQLRGIAESPTATDTITGAYNATLIAHEFSVYHTGYYTLWEDAAGGSSYTRRTDWSATTGKFIVGGDAPKYFNVDSRDIRWFGAKEGDSTWSACAENDTAFATAIDSGKSVYVPEGTWWVSSTINMETDAMLYGDGASSVIRSRKNSYAAGLVLVTIATDSNVIVKDLKFLPDDNTTYMIEHDHCVAIGDSVQNATVTDCFMTYCIGDGIYIGGGDTTNWAEDVLISNNYIFGDTLVPDNWALPMSRNGISLVNGKNIVIDGNSIRGFNGPGCIDVEPNPAVGQRIDDAIISDNTIEASTNGIIVNSPSGGQIRRIKVVDNNIDYIGYQTVDYPGYGIYFVDFGSSFPDNYIISGNHIYNMPNNGIFSRNILSGGDISNNVCFKNSGNGIQVSGSCYGVTVSGNKCYENTGHGIHMFGSTVADVTDSVTNADFELTSGWSGYGTPLTAARSSAHVMAGTYSWKIRTDAAGEGIYQVASRLDTGYHYLVECYTYLFDDSSFSGVEMDIAGGNSKHVLTKARESGFDSTWQYLSVLFKPSGTDTIILKSNTGGCHFYVDSLTIDRFVPMERCQVTNNECKNNGDNGIQVTANLLNSHLTGNIVYNDAKFTTSGAATQDRGIYVPGSLIKCQMLDNTGWNHSGFDFYANNLLSCGLSFRGFDSVFVDVNTTAFWGNYFPYAKTIMVRGDVVPNTTYTNFGGYWNMIDQGSFIAMSSNSDSAFTAGIVNIFPTIGDTYHASSGTVSSTIEYTSTGSVIGANRLFVGYPEDRYFKRGDRVTIHVAADASVPDTAAINIMLMYE